MPKHTFPAAAEGMPNFNRRTFLQGAASTGVAAGIVVVPAVAEAAPAGIVAVTEITAAESLTDSIQITRKDWYDSLRLVFLAGAMSPAQRERAIHLLEESLRRSNKDARS